jgi:hypothetical protein
MAGCWRQQLVSDPSRFFFKLDKDGPGYTTPASRLQDIHPAYFGSDGIVFPQSAATHWFSR